MIFTLYGLLALLIVAASLIWLVKILQRKPYVRVKVFGVLIVFRDSYPTDRKKRTRKKPAP